MNQKYADDGEVESNCFKTHYQNQVKVVYVIASEEQRCDVNVIGSRKFSISIGGKKILNRE